MHQLECELIGHQLKVLFLIFQWVIKTTFHITSLRFLLSLYKNWHRSVWRIVWPIMANKNGLRPSEEFATEYTLPENMAYS